MGEKFASKIYIEKKTTSATGRVPVLGRLNPLLEVGTPPTYDRFLSYNTIHVIKKIDKNNYVGGFRVHIQHDRKENSRIKCMSDYGEGSRVSRASLEIAHTRSVRFSLFQTVNAQRRHSNEQHH